MNKLLIQTGGGSGSGGSPTGSAGGDLGGTYPNPTVVSVADVTTGVIAPANGGVGVVSSSGIGGFWGGNGIGGQFPFNFAAAVQVGANNQVRYVRFVLPFKTTIGRLTAEAATASSVCDFGIYSADGSTLLANTGAVTYALNTATTTALAQGSVTLNPGVYVFAYTTSVSTNTIYGCGSNSISLMGNNTAQCGTAANAATAGALPSSLGALTRSIANTSMPGVFFEP